MTMKLIKGATEINKAIASIANRGAKLDESIHVAGVSALAHTFDHGDPSLCDKLVNAMPRGSRKLALVEWMLAYGTIAKLDPKEDKDAIAAGRIFKLDKTRKLDTEGAMAESWTEFRKEPAVHTAFDAQAAVASVINRLKSAQNSKLSIEHRAEALAQAQALVAMLAAPVAQVEAAPL